MNSLIGILVLTPVSGFLISLLVPGKNERALSFVTFLFSGLHLLLSLIFVVLWMIGGIRPINVKEFIIYQGHDYEFFIDLYFDHITAVYLIVGGLLSFLISVYSRYYMHREEGYKRFFNTLLFFYVGYIITIFSGNFETLFLGWEILGVSSFLLIAFYRDRYLPVRNAMKVFSIYRIGDIGLILAMWLSHHLWHANITFLELNNHAAVNMHLTEHRSIGYFISVFILLAVVVKSAQFPFSFWLPRAMEGPTPSSAIFYSSLSVHIGAFILFRTYPLWESLPAIQITIIAIGLITATLATLTAQVQSSVKAQIAYSSIAQIGIILIEIALGFELLALIHFAGNAFLRTYQLLISPSVVAYLIKDQFYHFKAHEQKASHPIKSRLISTIYLFSLKEWFLDSISFYWLWSPLKRLGNFLQFLSPKIAALILLPVFIIGCLLLINPQNYSAEFRHTLAAVITGIGLLLSIRSFAKRNKAKFSWLLIFQNHLWITLGVTFNTEFNYVESVLYLSGIIVSAIVGYLVLAWLDKKENNVDLNRFQGHSTTYKTAAFIFLLATLGMAGFPITPAFIGEDLIFSHIDVNQVLLLLFVSFSFVVNGLALMRIYSRIFMGPSIKSDRPIAGRSS